MDAELIRKLSGMSREERMEYLKEHRPEMLGDSDLASVNGGEQSMYWTNPNSIAQYSGGPLGCGGHFSSDNYICKARLVCALERSR